MAQAGWNSFGVAVRGQELPRSTEFRLPMYRSGLNESEINDDNLLNGGGRTVDNSDPYVSGFMVIGV